MTDPIICPNPACRAHIGDVTVITPGIEPLEIGNYLITTSSGTCKLCGAEIHFNAAGHKFAKAIREWRAKEAKTRPV